MIWNSNNLNQFVYSPQQLQPCAWQAIRVFWRFSNFYGKYQSLPSTQRRRFVESLESQRQR
jgi:hypothetical protein